MTKGSRASSRRGLQAAGLVRLPAAAAAAQKPQCDTLGDILAQLGFEEQKAFGASLSRDDRCSLRLVNKATRRYLDSLTSELKLTVSDALQDTSDVRKVTALLPTRWPRCTRLDIIVTPSNNTQPGQQQPGRAAMHLQAALAAHAEMTRQLQHLSLGAARETPTAIRHVPTPLDLLRYLPFACPLLRSLQLGRGVELDRDNADCLHYFKALSRLPHLEELALPDCSGLEHVGLLAGLTKLTLLSTSARSAPGQAPAEAGAGPTVLAAPPLPERLRQLLSPVSSLQRLRELYVCCDRSAERAALYPALHGALPRRLERLSADLEGLTFEHTLSAGSLVELRLVDNSYRCKALWPAAFATVCKMTVKQYGSCLPSGGPAPRLVVERLELSAADEASGDVMVGKDWCRRVRAAQKLWHMQVNCITAGGSTPVSAVLKVVELLGLPARMCLFPGDEWNGDARYSFRLQLPSGDAARSPDGAAVGGDGGEGSGTGVRSVRLGAAATPAAGQGATSAAGEAGPGVTEGGGDAAAAPSDADLFNAYVQENTDLHAEAQHDGGRARAQHAEHLKHGRSVLCGSYGMMNLWGCLGGWGVVTDYELTRFRRWMRQSLDNADDVESFQLLLEASAFVLKMHSQEAAEAALDGLPSYMEYCPLDAGLVYKSVGECGSQLLQDYLDAPVEGGGSPAPSVLRARVERVLRSWRQVADIMLREPWGEDVSMDSSDSDEDSFDSDGYYVHRSFTSWDDEDEVEEEEEGEEGEEADGTTAAQVS